MSARRALKALLPPMLYGSLARSSGRALRFTGHHTTWDEACAASTGYDDQAILDRVVRATREVVAGRAAFERDSVLFERLEAPFQLLAPLLRHALRSGGHLDVVDFGGSLGNTFRQCRPFLPALAGLHWQVVEQPAFVAAGQAEFANAELSFHASIAALPPPADPACCWRRACCSICPIPTSCWGR